MDAHQPAVLDTPQSRHTRSDTEEERTRKRPRRAPATQDMASLEFQLPSTFDGTATSVEVWKGDGPKAVEKLFNQEKQEIPVLLMMANPDHPGGGVDNGRMAQEEDSCLPIEALSRTCVVEGKHAMYDFDINLTENIMDCPRQRRLVFHSLVLSEKMESKVPPTQRSEEVVIPAGKETKEDLDELGALELTPPFAILTQLKIRGMLLVAQNRKYKDLVISPWGCGALGYPREHLAFLFKEVISEFAGAFRRIIFAIPPGKTSEAFQNMFGPPIKPMEPPRRSDCWYRSLEKLEVQPKMVCKSGGLCSSLHAMDTCRPAEDGFESKAACESWHPPLCPCDPSKIVCPKHGRWHRALYSHSSRCLRAGGVYCGASPSHRWIFYPGTYIE